MRSVLRRFSDGLGDLADVRRPAVEAGLLAVLELESELGGDHDLIANRRERFADEFFVRERPVRFGGVEERDAAINGRADDADPVLRLRGRPRSPKLMPMHPKPSADTSNPLVPNSRFCIPRSLSLPLTQA